VLNKPTEENKSQLILLCLISTCIVTKQHKSTYLPL